MPIHKPTNSPGFTGELLQAYKEQISLYKRFSVYLFRTSSYAKEFCERQSISLMINIILIFKVDPKTNTFGRKSPAVIIIGTKLYLW